LYFIFLYATTIIECAKTGSNSPLNLNARGNSTQIGDYPFVSQLPFIWFIPKHRAYISYPNIFQYKFKEVQLLQPILWGFLNYKRINWMSIICFLVITLIFLALYTHLFKTGIWSEKRDWFFMWMKLKGLKLHLTN